MVDYWLSFLAGFFGSMHCVGMCGAIVLGYSTQSDLIGARISAGLAAHAAYNSGRVLSYTILGSLFGLLGSGITVLRGIGEWFSLLIGLLMLIWAVALLKIVPGFSSRAELPLRETSGSVFFELYRKFFGGLVGRPGLESKFYVGFLTPLLPCGLLYSMFVKAAGSASMIQGAIIMLLFGLGIVPALTITGFAGSFFRHRLRVWGDKLAAITILLMGLVMIVRALGVPLPLMGGHQHMH